MKKLTCNDLSAISILRRVAVSVVKLPRRAPSGSRGLFEFLFSQGWAAAVSKAPGGFDAVPIEFSRTGGIHASALFDVRGHLCAISEDVGRHNALDRLIGNELLAGRTDFSDLLLLVSGRASFELVQKSVMAGSRSWPRSGPLLSGRRPRPTIWDVFSWLFARESIQSLFRRFARGVRRNGEWAKGRAGEEAVACIAHKCVRICERCRLVPWVPYVPSAPQPDHDGHNEPSIAPGWAPKKQGAAARDPGLRFY